MSSKKFLHNPWAIATGSTILGVIGMRFIDYITGTNIISSILGLIAMILATISNFILLKYEVPLWVLIILPIIIIGLIFLILWITSLFYKKDKIQEIQKQTFLNYREGVFGEILYRWEYMISYGNKYEISNISHFCPKCKCLIVYQRCPICHAFFMNSKSDIEIRALIMHKIEMNYKN